MINGSLTSTVITDSRHQHVFILKTRRGPHTEAESPSDSHSRAVKDTQLCHLSLLIHLHGCCSVPERLQCPGESLPLHTGCSELEITDTLSEQTGGPRQLWSDWATLWPDPIWKAQLSADNDSVITEERGRDDILRFSKNELSAGRTEKHAGERKTFDLRALSLIHPSLQLSFSATLIFLIRDNNIFSSSKFSSVWTGWYEP